MSRGSGCVASKCQYAYSPAFPSLAPNRPVTLYEGDLELKQQTGSLSGIGNIQLEWLPVAGPRFSLNLPFGEWDRIEAPICELHIVGLGKRVRVRVAEWSNRPDDGVCRVRGRIEKLEIGRDQHVRFVVLHIVNFAGCRGSDVRDESATNFWYGRATIEAGEWRLTLDELKKSADDIGVLKATGGFAVTHVGRLERLDGKAFAVNKTQPFCEAVARYLSFCQGAWVGLILPVGFDDDSNRTWDRWEEVQITGWRSSLSWFSSTCDEGLSRWIPRFL